MKIFQSFCLVMPLLCMLTACSGCAVLDIYKLPDGNTIEQEVIEEAEKIMEDEYEKNVQNKLIK